jgi:predicted CxxxxCH...CXXCH cytochrome family protein
LKTDLPVASTGALKVHPDGWLTKASTGFHGKEIQRQSWSLKGCIACHGASYNGGTSGVSCLTCHYTTSAAENCTACHGTSGVNAAPPFDLSGNTARTARGVGAHQVHLAGGTWSARVQCNACHVVPTTVIASGHLDGVAGAEVRLDTVTFRAVGQQYEFWSTGRCDNTYCHGNFTNGKGLISMLWTDVTGTSAACGTCHGDTTLADPEDRARPKTISQGGTHPNKGAFGTTKCSNCHGNVVDANLNFVDKSKHVDGQIN